MTAYRFVGGPYHRKTIDCQYSQFEYVEPIDPHRGWYRVETIVLGGERLLRVMLHQGLSRLDPQTAWSVLDAFADEIAPA